MNEVKRDEEPFDDLTELSNRMLDHLPDGVQGIVLLRNETESAIGASGWGDDTEIILQMIESLKAILKSRGMDVSIMTDEGFYV